MNKIIKHRIELQEELIRRCRRNDERAQLVLYNSHIKAMLNTSYRILGNYENAEDVVQEAFLTAFRRIKTFKGEVTFGAWLKRIVINHSIDFLRKKHPDLQSVDSYEGYEMKAVEEDITEIKRELDIKEVKNAITRLPKGYQLVLNLYLFEGYDHEEIGQILSISSSTSRSQYTRAKQKLAEELKKTK